MIRSLAPSHLSGRAGRTVLLLGLLQAVVAAVVVAVQLRFAFDPDARASPVSFYTLVNLLIASGSSFAASLSPDYARGLRRMLLAAAFAFAGVFAVEAIAGDADGALGGWTVVWFWVGAAVCLVAALKSDTFPAFPRRALTVALAAQGLAIAADLIDDGALGGDGPVLTWVYVVSNVVSIAAYQLGFMHLALDAKVGPVLRRAFDAVFERGLGGRAAGMIADWRFARFQAAHPGKTYADFYAHRATRTLERGAAHKTLGTRKYAPDARRSGGDAFTTAEFAARGLSYFRWFEARGLRSDMTCVDYGCGSLRVGQHFIRRLDPDRYIGLDVSDRFYREGLSLIEPAVVAAKRPRLAVISPASIAEAAAREPDLIYSTAVLQHVPPEELALYFGAIVAMMAERTVAIANFQKADAEVRIGSSAWARSPAELIAAVRRVDPSVLAMVRDDPERSRGVYPQANLLLARDRAALAKWLRA